MRHGRVYWTRSGWVKGRAGQGRAAGRVQRGRGRSACFAQHVHTHARAERRPDDPLRGLPCGAAPHVPPRVVCMHSAKACDAQLDICIHIYGHGHACSLTYAPPPPNTHTHGPRMEAAKSFGSVHHAETATGVDLCNMQHAQACLHADGMLMRAWAAALHLHPDTHLHLPFHLPFLGP